MNLNNLNKLLQKREQLQTRIKFDDFVKLYVDGFVEILKEVQLLKIHYKIVSWRCVPNEFHVLLSEYIKKDAFLKNNDEETELFSDDSTVEELLKLFPSVNPLRYVPDLEIVHKGCDISALLHTLFKSNEIINSTVYFCWLKYPAIVIMDVCEFAELANDEILGFWHGDLVIFPNNFAWLLTYSIEDEWRFGINGFN